MDAFIEGVFKVIAGLFKVWFEMLMAVVKALPRIFGFLGWLLAGFIILPCVLISHHYYGKWADWGEKNL